MSEEKKVSLNDAKNTFMELMRALEKRDKERFVCFIAQEWMPQSIGLGEDSFSDNEDDDVLDDPLFTLNAIVADIKKKVPFSAIFDSETIISPQKGENADCKPEVTCHVDEFLYDEDEVKTLEDKGKLKRHYCLDCGSKNVESMIMLSHSTAREDLYYIFNTLLPTLKGKTVLDVGSRLGAVLYGAYVYTDASRIIGVEMNKDFCELQKDIIAKYKMGHRVEVVNQRIEKVPELVREADVINFNNVFEFYLPPAEQTAIWQYLRNTIKKGCILVTRPHLDVTFKNLNTEIDLDKWVKPMAKSSDCIFDMNNDDSNTEYDHSDIACYEVL